MEETDELDDILLQCQIETITALIDYLIKLKELDPDTNLISSAIDFKYRIERKLSRKL